MLPAFAQSGGTAPNGGTNPSTQPATAAQPAPGTDMNNNGNGTGDRGHDFNFGWLGLLGLAGLLGLRHRGRNDMRDVDNVGR